MAGLSCIRLRLKSRRVLFLLVALFSTYFHLWFVLLHVAWDSTVVKRTDIRGYTSHLYDHNSTSDFTLYAITKVMPKNRPTKKPVIDMVNDYQPFVNFKFVFPEIMPVIKDPRNFLMIVLVNSGSRGDEFRKRRDTTRKTWGNHENCEQLKAMSNPMLKNLTWMLVFVLGKAGTDEDKMNLKEAKKHNDMVIGDIADNYLNNIIKYYMGQLWASTFNVRYTLKCDDDVYLRIPGIIEYLANASFPNHFYGGGTYRKAGVMRWPGGRWSVSKKYFPEDVWPPFNAGAFFILSADLLANLFNYVYIRKPFHTDDAYVGVAMRDLKVVVTHILSFDIRNNMASLIKKMNDDEILGLLAYGHNVDPDSAVFLHKRIESLCRNV